MKNKKIWIVICLVLSICLIALGTVFILFQKDKKEESLYARLKDGKTIEICPNEECGIYSTLKFPQIETNITDEAFVTKVEEINNQSNTYYNEVEKQAENGTCTNAETGAEYEYPLNIEYIVDVTEQENIINIFTYTEKHDQCTNELSQVEVTSYFYDLENKKELSMEEYMNKKGLTYDILDQSIEESFRKQYTKEDVDTVIEDIKNNRQYIIKNQEDQMMVYYYSNILNGWLTMNEDEIKR